jgi:hypothetical protein
MLSCGTFGTVPDIQASHFSVYAGGHAVDWKIPAIGELVLSENLC